MSNFHGIQDRPARSERPLFDHNRTLASAKAAICDLPFHESTDVFGLMMQREHKMSDALLKPSIEQQSEKWPLAYGRQGLG